MDQLAVLTWLLLTSEMVVPSLSEPACPCVQQDRRMQCWGWQDFCPRSPLPSTSLLAITDSPNLTTININNINTQEPGHRSIDTLEINLNDSVST